MASSVWTATVWGQGKAALLAATNRKIQPGEEECHICKDDVPASVALRPCGHMVCFGCVENLRAKNIFRADKGVKCPFCRQYVTQYEPCNSADPEQVRLLNEANRAAAFASAARTPNVNGPASAAAQRTVAAAPAEDSWMCTSCRCLNLAHREECSSCSRANPRPKQTGSNRNRDVLKCSDDEVIGYMFERCQPFLQRCYSEAGLGFSLGRIVTDEDTPQRILNAFKQRGEERLMRVVKILASPETFLEVAVHFHGNYALQTLVEATLKIREAIDRATAMGQAVLSWFRSAHEGRDPQAVLLYAALPNAAELSRHERANYLIQKLADNAAPQELVELCGAVFPHGPSLVRDHKGVYVMNNLLSKLKEVCSDGTYRFDACELADGLCWHFMEEPDKLKFCLHNTLASKVLASAIALGLPQYGALQLGSQVASSAMRLMTSKNGPACVLSMLEMESADEMCSELIRDLVCTVAMQLQGSLYELLMQITCPDDRAPQVVRKLLQRLAAEHEDDWLDAICQELVNYGDIISENYEALEVLKEALCFDVQDDESVVDHITQLRQIVPSKAVMRSIEEEVCNRRDSNPDPPAPRYHAPSFITPSLKYMLGRGMWLPAPPPPPPKADEMAPGIASAGAYGTNGAGAGRVLRRGAQPGGRGVQHSGVNSTFDESYFAEGLFDPAAPVQAVGGAADVDGWGTANDPWSNASAGEDWLAAAPAPPPPVADGVAAVVSAPAPAPVPTSAAAPPPTSPSAGQVAGQMLLQSLQRPGPVVHATSGDYPAAATSTPVAVAVAAAAPQPPAPLRPIAQPNPTVLPAATAPTRLAGLPTNIAVNPTLAAARAVAHAAMQARQQAAQQQAAPVVIQPQQQVESSAAAQPPVAAQVPLYHQAHLQQQAQQQPSPFPPTAVVAPEVHPASRGDGANGIAAAPVVATVMAVPAPAGHVSATPYMPVAEIVAAAAPPPPPPPPPPIPAALRPHAPVVPYPLALFNPALAVLNNTAGITAFAPRVNATGMVRPVAVPVAQVPTAAQPPPTSSVAAPAPSVAVQQAAVRVPPSSISAAAAAATAAMATRHIMQMPQTQAQVQAPPAAASSPPSAGRGQPTASSDAKWQCQICTYEHKGPESQFLACAICGCERGLQHLPS